jgi:hypothetical protein
VRWRRAIGVVESIRHSTCDSRWAVVCWDRISSNSPVFSDILSTSFAMAHAAALLGSVVGTTQLIQEEVTQLHRALFNHSAGQEVLCDLWNPIIHLCPHKNTPLALIVVQLNKVHPLISCLCKIYFNVILPSILNLLVFSIQGVRPGLRSYVISM